MLPESQNLEAAFRNGEVSDLIEFFRQDALSPLCHDRFPELIETLRESMADGDEWVADLLTTLDKVMGCSRPKERRIVSISRPYLVDFFKMKVQSSVQNVWVHSVRDKRHQHIMASEEFKGCSLDCLF